MVDETNDPLPSNEVGKWQSHTRQHLVYRLDKWEQYRWKGPMISPPQKKIISKYEWLQLKIDIGLLIFFKFYI